jgi:hypothetical protein
LAVRGWGTYTEYFAGRALTGSQNKNGQVTDELGVETKNLVSTYWGHNRSFALSQESKMKAARMWIPLFMFMLPAAGVAQNEGAPSSDAQQLFAQLKTLQGTWRGSVMLDLTGPTTHGHMNRAVFTFVDADRHIEEWTYTLPNGAKIRAQFDLRRVKTPPGSTGAH